jgi:hypothetical protein
MFIAAVAARDTHRPTYVVERASKILASSTWSGSGYQSLYQTPVQMRDALAKAGISLIVTDLSMPIPSPHERLLLDSMIGAGFTVLCASTAVRDGAPTPAAIELHHSPAVPQ